MAILWHELRQGKNAFFIWTVIVAFMLAICIFIYPEMEEQMGEINGAFAEMGDFSAAIGISAFISRSGIGIGLGIAALFYFLNIISNLTKEAKFLKYIIPFGYTESADIITNRSIKMKYLAVGLGFTAAGILAAFWKYKKKDILF